MQPGPRPPRRRNHSRRRAGGLSIAELMVTLVVISILSAAVVPDFMRHVYRARRSEALFGLRAIHDAETFYYANTQHYTDSFHLLGVPIEGGVLREDGAVDGHYYTYSLATWDMGDRPNANYRATATGDIDPSDATLDIVIIENQLTVHD